MKARKVANPLGLAVLALLWERPMHPYEMAATLRERGKEHSIRINYGSLYSVVGALSRAGFIVPAKTSRAGSRPERTVYAATPQGRAELRDWLSELLSRPAKEYPQFEAALSLMPCLPPTEVAALLDQRVRQLGQEHEALRSVIEQAKEQGLARLFLIEAEYSLAMREAEREWVLGLLGLLRESPDFTRTWEGIHAVERPAGDAGEPEQEES